MKDSDKILTVRFKPLADSEYRYEFTEVSEVSQEIGKSGNQTKTSIQTKIDFDYKIDGVDKEGYFASVVFSDGKTVNTSEVFFADRPFEKDSTHFDKSIDGLKGLKLSMRLNRDGKIMSIFENGGSLLSVLDRSIYNEIYFRKILSRISELLPTSGVKIGATWTLEKAEEDGIRYGPRVFELQRSKDSSYYFRSTADVSKEIMANKTTLQMVGKDRSVIEVDQSTGIVLRDLRKTTLGGITKIGGIDISQSLFKTSNLIGSKGSNRIK